MRRGNTSGLIGLWNQRERGATDDEKEEGGGGGGNVLKIREDAARRISVRTPAPPPVTRRGLLGDGLNSPKYRKSSEIVRPTFETSSESLFVARKDET